MRLDAAERGRGRGGGKFGEDKRASGEMGIKSLEGEEDQRSNEMGAYGQVTQS